jgi:hypothetical protein
MCKDALQTVLLLLLLLLLLLCGALHEQCARKTNQPKPKTKGRCRSSTETGRSGSAAQVPTSQQNLVK